MTNLINSVTTHTASNSDQRKYGKYRAIYRNKTSKFLNDQFIARALSSLDSTEAESIDSDDIAYTAINYYNTEVKCDCCNKLNDVLISATLPDGQTWSTICYECYDSLQYATRNVNDQAIGVCFNAADMRTTILIAMAYNDDVAKINNNIAYNPNSWGRRNTKSHQIDFNIADEELLMIKMLVDDRDALPPSAYAIVDNIIKRYVDSLTRVETVNGYKLMLHSDSVADVAPQVEVEAVANIETIAAIIPQKDNYNYKQEQHMSKTTVTHSTETYNGHQDAVLKIDISNYQDYCDPDLLARFDDAKLNDIDISDELSDAFIKEIVAHIPDDFNPRTTSLGMALPEYFQCEGVQKKIDSKIGRYLLPWVIAAQAARSATH